jgi:hypothetical protein
MFEDVPQSAQHGTTLGFRELHDGEKASKVGFGSFNITHARLWVKLVLGKVCASAHFRHGGSRPKLWAPIRRLRTASYLDNDDCGNNVGAMTTDGRNGYHLIHGADGSTSQTQVGLHPGFIHVLPNTSNKESVAARYQKRTRRDGFRSRKTPFHSVREIC